MEKWKGVIVENDRGEVSKQGLSAAAGRPCCDPEMEVWKSGGVEKWKGGMME